MKTQVYLDWGDILGDGKILIAKFYKKDSAYVYLIFRC